MKRIHRESYMASASQSEVEETMVAVVAEEAEAAENTAEEAEGNDSNGPSLSKEEDVDREALRNR